MAPATFPVTLIVLAAGKSERMGESKLLLPLNGTPMLTIVLNKLKNIPVLEKLVVVNPAERKLRTLIDPTHYRLVLNPDYEEGLGASIRYGVWASRDTSRGYLFYLADMPLVTPETVQKLLEGFDSAHPRSIVVPVFNGKRGNPVLVGRAYRERLLNIPGDMGARQIIQEAAEHVVEIPVHDPGILWDVDTKAAYQETLNKLGRH